jgi:predicted nucleic acid-binding protein
VTLVDSSAWIEFLRDTGSPACERVSALLTEGAVMTCGPVRMELLAGARDDVHLVRLRRLLARATSLGTAPADFDRAAGLYRACRRQGETVRRLVDCVIAAHALRAGVPVLHRDVDFEVLARHTPLELDPL